MFSCKKNSEESQPVTPDTSSGGGNQANPPAFIVADYYPLKVGNEWTYKGVAQFYDPDTVNSNWDWLDTIEIIRRIESSSTSPSGAPQYSMVTYIPKLDKSYYTSGRTILKYPTTITVDSNAILEDDRGIFKEYVLKTGNWEEYECYSPELCPRQFSDNAIISIREAKELKDTVFVKYRFLCKFIGPGNTPSDTTHKGTEWHHFAKGIGPMEYISCRTTIWLSSPGGESNGIRYYLSSYKLN